MNDTTRIPALSVRPPWSSWIIEGQKSIETRWWSTVYRGVLAVHAAKTVDDSALASMPHLAGRALWPRGVVLGLVDLIDCRAMRPEDEAAALCPYMPGLFAWVVANPRPFAHPPAARGMPGIFRLELIMVPGGESTATVAAAVARLAHPKPTSVDNSGANVNNKAEVLQLEPGVSGSTARRTQFAQEPPGGLKTGQGSLNSNPGHPRGIR